jgi:hypothetical protein
MSAASTGGASTAATAAASTSASSSSSGDLFGGDYVFEFDKEGPRFTFFKGDNWVVKVSRLADKPAPTPTTNESKTVDGEAKEETSSGFSANVVFADSDEGKRLKKRIKDVKWLNSTTPRITFDVIREVKEEGDVAASDVSQKKVDSDSRK